MNKILFTALLLSTSQLFAASEKKIKSNIKNVTVFTQGAQVFRSAPITLSPGVTQVVLTGISAQVNPASIQAGGKGNFIVLDVKHNVEYPEPPSPEASKLPASVLREIKFLEDSVSDIGFSNDELEDKKSALLLEKDMILKNKLSKGEGKSDSLAVLKQAMEFFRLKLDDINTQLNRISRQERKNKIERFKKYHIK